MSLIQPENHIAVVAALLTIALIGFAIEKTKIARVMPGAMFAILGSAAFANLRIIPDAAPAYDFVFVYCTPILIPLFLVRANIVSLFGATARVTLAFLLASFATVLGVLSFVFLLDLGEFEAHIAGLLTSSYIGGGVNIAALSDVTGLRNEPTVLGAINAADTVIGMLFLMILFLLPSQKILLRFFAKRDHSVDSETDIAATEAPISSLSLTGYLTLAFAIVAISDLIVGALDIPQYRYLLITTLSVLPGSLFPERMNQSGGSLELGLLLSFVFFGALGAGANVVAMITTAPIFALALVILVSVHFVVLLPLAAIFRLSLPETLIASNAAVAGPTTVPAMTAAFGWKALTAPGVIAGVFGYALGTFAGVIVFQLLS